MNAKDISKVKFVGSLGSSPASVNRVNGVMLVNKNWFNSLPKEQRYFILLHEKGHVVCNTSNEFKADDWAFKEYASQGYSLKDAILALVNNLKFIDRKRGKYSALGKEQKNRVLMQIIRCKIYDYKILGNENYKDWYNKNFTN